MSLELYVSFLARELGTIPQEVPCDRAPAQEVQTLLLPAVSYFNTVAGIAEYKPEAEAEADAVLEALEADPTGWTNYSSDAAKVLYERALFAANVLEIDAKAGELAIAPPQSLDEGLRQVAAVLLWLHRTKLPDDWVDRPITKRPGQ